MLQTIEVHPNCLTTASVPFRYAAPVKPPPEITKQIKHEWCETHVIIIKPKHPRKGEPGVITDVSQGQLADGPLRLQVQMINYDPSSPYQRIIVDYDDVVELTSVVF
jgi:hypothetical protein